MNGMISVILAGLIGLGGFTGGDVPINTCACPCHENEVDYYTEDYSEGNVCGDPEYYDNATGYTGEDYYVDGYTDGDYCDDECYIDEEFYNDGYYGDETFDNVDGYYGDENLYNDGKIEFDESAEAKAKSKKVKELLEKLIPTDKLSRIKEIKVFTDGKDETLAFVENMDETGKDWRLAFDKLDVNLDKLDKDGRRDVIWTLVHEYSHIESLNETQVNYGKRAKNENEIDIEEGALKESSYLNKFAKKFWTKEMIKMSESGDIGEALKLYDENPTDFVSDYATSNLVEDFAESFAKFVLSDKASGDSKADKKVNFFYDFPELVKLRNHMRAAVPELL